MNTSNRASLLLVLFVSISSLISCGDNKATTLHLLADPPKQLDSEAERMRQMQAITVFNTVTKQNEEVTGLDLYFPFSDACGTCTFAPGCGQDLCTAAWGLCIAKNFLAATRPQATPITLGNWTIPLQMPSANVELASWAKQQARAAADEFSIALEAMSGSPRSGQNNCGTFAASAVTASSGFAEVDCELALDHRRGRGGWLGHQTPFCRKRIVLHARSPSGAGSSGDFGL